MTNKNPVYDNDLLKFTGQLNKDTGEYIPLTKSDMETYLTEQLLA